MHSFHPNSLRNNPVTFSFIACIIALYLALLFCAVRLDRRDVVKGRVIELIDNNARHSQKYVLEFETGMRLNAGTTAKVGVHFTTELEFTVDYATLSG